MERGAEDLGDRLQGFRVSEFQSFKVSRFRRPRFPCRIELVTAMDFIWFLGGCVVVAFLWFLTVALKVRARKRAVTVDAIGAAMIETRDDPDEPARWVP